MSSRIMPAVGRRSTLPRALGAAALGGLLAATVVTATPAAAAPTPRPQKAHSPCPRLDPALPWYGDNQARINDVIAELGRCGDHPAVSGKAPLATFDWDNTVVRNDVGDAMTYYLLRHDKVLQPPKGDWARTSPYLSAAAVTALGAACGDAGAPGQPMRTSTDLTCADEILAVYSDATTTAGAAAFDPTTYDHRRMEPAYAWAAQLQAGYTDRQLRDFARRNIAEVADAPEGSTVTVGHRTVDAWVRYYPQIRDLIGALDRAGFDVRIVSASAQPIVQAWAEGLGLPARQVLGIRTLQSQGRHTYGLATCGTAADATPARTAITYMDGKRCWINQAILHQPRHRVWEQAPQALRQVVAAGDSDTDVTFVDDATGLHLTLNRNKAELMCRAYFDADGRWLVNPMFIEPKPQKVGTYPCSTTAGTAPDGTARPVTQDGVPIPDQVDSVF